MINIRKSHLKDLELLAVLFDAYRIFYSKESNIAAAKEFLSTRMIAGESTIFVAESSENLLVGFVQLYPLFSSTRMKKLWLLNDLFVHNKYRGQGISIALINASKDLCIETEACGLILETAKTNDIGNNLYPKTDFDLDCEHNFYSWDIQ